jgi:hypothetical protein
VTSDSEDLSFVNSEDFSFVNSEDFSFVNSEDFNFVNSEHLGFVSSEVLEFVNSELLGFVNLLTIMILTLLALTFVTYDRGLETSFLTVTSLIFLLTFYPYKFIHINLNFFLFLSNLIISHLSHELIYYSSPITNN